jgi:hypothetical protein
LSPDLGKLEYVEPRTLWESEPRHFTPWLAKNLGLLGEALGLDLEFLKAEVEVGSFKADVAARDTGRDRQVIIENQLEPTDHCHLGQLLTYASGLDAAVIVWISPEIREEHRQALDWLNRNTTEKIEFFGIALEVVRINDSKPAVVFRLAASPNAWTKTVNAAQASQISPREEAYQAFFQLVMDELREKHRFTNAKRAQPQSWYAFRSGVVSDITYNVAFASGNRLRAELYINGAATKNKAIYDALMMDKTAIEALTGELVWERLDQRQASRISLVRSNTNIDDAAKHGEEMRSWLVQALLKIKAAFGPRLEAAAQAADQPLQSELGESGA